MVTLLGISGSLRKGSLNTALMQAAAALPANGYRMDTAGIHGIPLYDGDLEDAEGIPAAVAALKEKIISADGVILFTPEYNNGIPGAFKNAIDWLSRPSSDMARVLVERPSFLSARRLEISARCSARMPGSRCCTRSAAGRFRKSG